MLRYAVVTTGAILVILLFHRSAGEPPGRYAGTRRLAGAEPRVGQPS